MIEAAMSETTKSPKLKNSKRERDSGVANKLKISEEFSESDREWASLPLDVSFFIQDKLFEVVDRLCFAATCKEWLSLSKAYAKATQHSCKDAMGKVLPLLFSPTPEEEVHNKYEANLTAHSVSEEKRYSKLKWSLNEYGNRSVRCSPTIYLLPDSVYWTRLQTKWCGGSSHGWLAVVDLVEPRFNITLVHPFSKSMGPICLPPMDFMSKPYSAIDPNNYYPNYLSKVILSGPPSSNPHHCFDVIAICDRGKQLAFLKLGGQEEEIKDWVYVEEDHMTRLEDVVFYRNKVYAVLISGKIISFDISRCKLPKGKILAPAFENVLIERGARERSFVRSAYLVKSSKGDHLWHVRRVVVKRGSKEAKEERFEVYKVMLDNEDGSIVERIEVKSIGNEALFVGCSHSMSVLASNFPGCKPNSIYYKGTFYYQGSHISKPYQIFSLEDQPVQYKKLYKFRLKLSAGVWVLPTFN